jgi:hypothetical protein
MEGILPAQARIAEIVIVSAPEKSFVGPNMFGPLYLAYPPEAMASGKGFRGTLRPGGAPISVHPVTIHRNSLEGELNLQKRELGVKGISAQELGGPMLPLRADPPHHTGSPS